MSRPPYLVIRWMAAAYGHAPIHIYRDATEAHVADAERADHPRNVLSVVAPTFVPDQPLDAAARRAVIDAARARSAKTTLRMCVVFAADDAVYVEPDGRAHASSEPPHGGVRLDRVRVAPR